MKSRGALTGVFEAAGLSPLGEPEGAFRPNKALIAHKNANL